MNLDSALTNCGQKSLNGFMKIRLFTVIFEIIQSSVIVSHFTPELISL